MPDMRAVRAIKETQSSAPNVTVTTIAAPEPGPGQVLVKIHASAVQPADILNSKGGFPGTTFPRTLGKDFSGIVVRSGGPPKSASSSATASSPDLWIGKEVYGSSGNTFSFSEDGAQAEYAIVNDDCLALKPSHLSWAQAAVVGTPFTTAYLTLERARAQPGEVVMVLGATGAVGSAAMQIARAVFGCKVLGVGRHGTDVNSVDDPNLEEAKELTDGKGPDVVVDTVGDLTLTSAALKVLANKGRISLISAPRQGSTEMSVDVLSLYRRQIEIVGVNSAGMPQREVVAILGKLGKYFDEGSLLAPDEKSLSIVGINQAVDAYDGKLKHAVISFDE